MDLANAIVRGFEVGLSIVAALAVLLAVNIIFAIVKGMIGAFTERAEREEDEDTEQR